jgi:hypothetical protein
MIRRFHFLRTEDASGVSGTGIIAEGVVFSDGKVAVEWNGAHASTNLYSSLDDVVYIHGHQGRTQIIFDDDDTDSNKKD